MLSFAKCLAEKEVTGGFLRQHVHDRTHVVTEAQIRCEAEFLKHNAL